ncbi:MAG: DUF255 domain-containing protein [Polyangiales bacterium]
MKPRASLGLLALAACATSRGLAAPGTPPSVDITLARARASPVGPAWNPLAPQVFARAEAEGRLVVFDAAAAWCHWCHVMDETTWRDPEVLALVARRFVPAREDVDARPDLAARYAAWGWPATVIFDARGRELARYRGYLSPARMRAALEAALASPTPLPEARGAAAAEVSLDARLADALDQMDRAYDPAQGSWGTNQKLSLGDNLRVELARAARGDADAAARARQTLTNQRRIYDPVWGGVYQYSAGATWGDPHFERLMSFQAPTLIAAARAAEVLRDPSFLDDARGVGRFIVERLTDADGAVHGSMDADVNAHDRAAPFIDGHVYFARGDAERARLGAPRVDPGAHPRDNGMAIEALVALEDATREGRWLEAARRAARAMVARHVDAEGRVSREGTRDRLLADAAWLALGLSTLAAHDRDAALDEVSRRVAARAIRDFAAPDGLLASRPSAPLPGALSSPQVPLSDNLAMVRALGRIASRDPSGRWLDEGRSLLRRALTPARIAAHGRFIGEALVAAESVGALPALVSERSEVAAGEGATLTVSLAPEGEGAALALHLRAGERHVNREFPTSLWVGGAAVAARIDARDESLRVTAALPRVAPASRVSGVLRWAACTASSCVPVETPFVVRRGLGPSISGRR